MANYRQGRLGGEIKRLLSEMLQREIKDPRLTERMISISDVEVTSDGSYATVYLSLLGALSGEGASEDEKAEVLQGFKSSAGMIRSRLGKKLTVRRVPELIFKFDEALEYGRHIDSIISSLGIENYHATDGSETDEEGARDE